MISILVTRGWFLIKIMQMTQHTDSWILFAIFLMIVCNLIMAMLADW